MLEKFGTWLLGLILKLIMGRALDEGESRVDKWQDEKTAEKNAKAAKESLEKEGVTDEELEKRFLDLTNGNP